MQFGNCTLWPSGETAVAGSGCGRSVVSITQNRTLEKADKDGRVGGVGGLLVDGVYISIFSLLFRLDV